MLLKRRKTQQQKTTAVARCKDCKRAAKRKHGYGSCYGREKENERERRTVVSPKLMQNTHRGWVLLEHAFEAPSVLVKTPREELSMYFSLSAYGTQSKERDGPSGREQCILN